MKVRKSVWFILAIIAFVVMITGCSIQGDHLQMSGSSVLAPNSIMFHRLGLIPTNPQKLQSKMLSVSKFTAVSLPSSVDMNASLPPVGDQGNQGSCSCWSTVYYNKTFLVGQEQGWSLTTTSHQFSPAWVYNQINGGADNGAEIGDAFQLMIDKGCDTLNNFPYDQNNFTKQPDQASFQRALAYCSSSWSSLPVDLTTIKTYLYQGHPIVIGIAVYPDFDNISTSHPIYSSMSGTLEGYHALCVIGYDDTKKAIKFANSWGASWGTYKNDSVTSQGIGYGWIAYSLITNKNFYFEANVMLDSSSQSSSSSTTSSKSTSTSSSVKSSSSISSSKSTSSSSSAKSSSSSAGGSTWLENLDNFPSTAGVYSDGTFAGTKVATWTYSQCRGDIIISGRTPCLGKDRSPLSQLSTSTISGGIKTLEFDYMQAFSTTVNFDVYVNSTLVTTVNTSTLNVVQHAGPFTVNTSGNFMIKFAQKAGSGQVCIDNIQWLSY